MDDQTPDFKELEELLNGPMAQFFDPQQYPDFWEQMKNFKDFAKSVGQDVAEGNGVLVSEQKLETRKQICNDCSQFNKDSKRCYLCGCFMEVKWKFKSASCPISMW